MTNLVHRRLRAPQADGAALIDPPLAEAAALLSANHRRALACKVDIDGQSLWQLAVTARSDLVGVAARHLRDETDSLRAWRKSLENRFNHGPEWVGPKPTRVPPDAEYYAPPMILTGHQPTLFHPGVWLKNFLLSALGKALDVPVVNLIVDNDLPATHSIPVPLLSSDVPRIAEIPFDRASEGTPWERRPVLDRVLFESFEARVCEVIATSRSGSSNVILREVWSEAIATSRRMSGRMPLGWCLAHARHEYERRIGLSTVEAPLSALCMAPSFLVFVVFLMHHLPRLHGAYNSSLVGYRIANRIRGHGRPVPELGADDRWLEAPLWLIDMQDGSRQRLFVRQVQGQIEFTDRRRLTLRLPGSGGHPTETAWLELPKLYVQHSFSIRPRALITTMYARLVLSDLFIHGIGGAKYDELTDEIIRRFFGIEPPGYFTATATFRLPIERPQVTVEDLREIVQRIRDVRYRPESFLGDPLLAREPAIGQSLESLADEKRHYLASHQVRRGSREEFLGLDRINRAMHDLLRPVEEHLRREHSRLIEDARRARLLGSREFSFVLFPEKYLVPRLLELSRIPA